MRLFISAKTSDCFNAHVSDNGEVIKDYDGYVPKFLGQDSDYLSLEIDPSTGMIVGWDRAAFQSWLKEN